MSDPTEETQPYQQRVIDERHALDEKLIALLAFLDGAVFATLPEAEQGRLEHQARHMQEYSDTLGDRIAAWSLTDITPTDPSLRDFITEPESVETRAIRQDLEELARWRAWAADLNTDFTGLLDHDGQLRQHISRRVLGWERVRLPVSSNIGRVDYQRRTETVRVTFGSGAVYDYASVPPEVIENWRAAPSAGKFFHATFRKSSAYPGHQVKAAGE